MLNKWLIYIALKGNLQCHKRAIVLWQRLIDIFIALHVALVSCIPCLIEDENASNVESDLLLDHRNTGCQRISLKRLSDCSG